MHAIIQNADAISVIADIVTALGVFSLVGGAIAFFVAYSANERAQRERAEYGTYDALDDRYIEFQRLTLAHPDLDMADISLANPIPLTDAQIHTRRILYQVLISTFERAFVMYKLRSEQLRDAQWNGWNTYINDYCKRPGFVDGYFLGTEPSEEFSATWDASFEADMKQRFRGLGLFAKPGL